MLERERERGVGKVRSNREIEGVWYLMSVVLGTSLRFTEDLFAEKSDCEGFFYGLDTAVVLHKADIGSAVVRL